jgi:hypothetical protein
LAGDLGPFVRLESLVAALRSHASTRQLVVGARLGGDPRASTVKAAVVGRDQDGSDVSAKSAAVLTITEGAIAPTVGEKREASIGPPPR